LWAIAVFFAALWAGKFLIAANLDLFYDEPTATATQTPTAIRSFRIISPPTTLRPQRYFRLHQTQKKRLNVRCALGTNPYLVVIGNVVNVRFWLRADIAGG